MGALRKYQYKFRLQMGPKDKPLLTEADIVEAIKRHFVKEMRVDYNEELGKFLSFKREEARADFAIHGMRREGRLRNNRAARLNQNNTAAAAANMGLNAGEKDVADGKSQRAANGGV